LPAAATWPPCSANRRAVAIPMPLVAPVTIATFPSNSISLLLVCQINCPQSSFSNIDRGKNKPAVRQHIETRPDQMIGRRFHVEFWSLHNTRPDSSDRLEHVARNFSRILPIGLHGPQRLPVPEQDRLGIRRIARRVSTVV